MFTLSFVMPFGIIGSVKTFQTFLWVMLASAVFGEGQPFERYQTIIDRKPFGPEPVNFDPEATPGSASANGGGGEGEMTPEQRTAEEQQLASSVRVSILNVTPAGVVKVGFTDSSANPPENYYMQVGGSQNGWTVKNAEPATESVTLEKDGVEVTVKLGESVGGGKGGGNAPRRPGARAGSLLGGASRPMAAGRPVAVDDDGKQRLGGLARLRQRRMEIAAREREDAERKREADAVARAEQEEREAREAEERQRAAAERAQQREALLQIQEQLKRQREEREAARRAQQEEQGEADDTE